MEGVSVTRASKHEAVNSLGFVSITLHFFFSMQVDVGVCISHSSFHGNG
jgi:hypothetical protein